jgi:hypothetical protein
MKTLHAHRSPVVVLVAAILLLLLAHTGQGANDPPPVPFQGHLYTFFTQALFNGPPEVYYSMDGGLPHNISHTSWPSLDPQAAHLGDDRLAVIWHEDTDPRGVLYFGLRDNRSGMWGSSAIPNTAGTLTATLTTNPDYWAFRVDGYMPDATGTRIVRYHTEYYTTLSTWGPVVFFSDVTPRIYLPAVSGPNYRMVYLLPHLYLPLLTGGSNGD